MSVKREDVLKYLEEANMIEISELVKDIEDKDSITLAFGKEEQSADNRKKW